MTMVEIEAARAKLATFDVSTLPPDLEERRKLIIDELVETRRRAGIKQPPDGVVVALVNAVLGEDEKRQNALLTSANTAARIAASAKAAEAVRTRPDRWKALGKDIAGNDRPLTVGQFTRAVLLWMEARGIPNGSQRGREWIAMLRFIHDPTTADREPPDTFEEETSSSAQLLTPANRAEMGSR